MTMLTRAALGPAAILACAFSAPALATPLQTALPESCTRADGVSVPCQASISVVPPAASTPQEGTVTATTAIATSGTATTAAGVATIGPFAPQLGRDIRVILRPSASGGSWTGTFAIGTSSAANACAAGTINPLTIGGQPWGVYTGNANEAVDTPSLGATPAGAPAPVYCATATITSGSLTYAVRQ